MTNTSKNNKRNAISHESEKEIPGEDLREVCINNGLDVNKLDAEGENVLELELFFNGFKKLDCVTHFCNLNQLRIFGQDIDCLEGIQYCLQLRKLWVCECRLTSTCGLGALTRLKKLCLYDNIISKVEGLETLSNLSQLWLNGNCIEEVGNSLQSLSELKILNLSDNRLIRLGRSLDANQNLETVHLSGNQLTSLKDIVNLRHLPQLRHLFLRGPQSAANPLCSLSNYSTYILFHLPGLVSLDSFKCTNKQPHELADSTVLKKRLFYGMRSRSTWRSWNALKHQMKKHHEFLLLPAHKQMGMLHAAQCQLDRDARLHESDQLLGAAQLDNNQNKANLDEWHAHASIKSNHLCERLKLWRTRVCALDTFLHGALAEIERQREHRLQLLQLELESGGNIRFEMAAAASTPPTTDNEDCPQDWQRLCAELLSSRFCANEYRHLGVVGVRVLRVTRVINRILSSMYDSRVAAELEILSVNSSCSNIAKLARKYQEYLFVSSNVAAAQLLDTLEHGFSKSLRKSELHNEEIGVPLSNSLNVADRQRVMHELSECTGNDQDCPFRFGRLLLAKVFLGKAIASVEKQVGPSLSASKVHALYRQQTPRVGDLNCECTSRQLEWFLLDPTLALPEYLIDFEYVTRCPPQSPFYCIFSRALETDEFVAPIDEQSISYFDESLDDADVLYLAPKAEPVATISFLSVDVLMKQCFGPNLSELNLHGCKLARLGPIDQLQNLRILKLTFNKLKRLDELSGMAIEQLDVRFNKLYTLDGFRNMTCLKQLDVSWNHLQNTREDVSFIRKHAANITHLCVNPNSWQKAEGLRLRLIGRLKNVVAIDGEPVTESELSTAVRLAAESRISHTMLASNSRTDESLPRLLSLTPIAQTLLITSSCKLEQGLADPYRYLKVTSLCLNSLHISKISNLERLENLRYLCLNDNDITKIEGLDSLTKLEELSLEHNCINQFEGLGSCVNLRRLLLSNNLLTSLMVDPAKNDKGLDALSCLQCLAVEGNAIFSLKELCCCTMLMECYFGSNYVADTREIFHLKALPNLLILDLFGNPLTRAIPNYRLTVIFHLRNLKALDGSAVELAELGAATNLLGGKLTADFLIEKFNHDRFLDLRELDFGHCALRSVDLNPIDQFKNLRSVNLEHNNLTSFSGLVMLPNLRVLCLNHNHVECFLPRSRGAVATLNGAVAQPQVTMESLEVLHLGHNGIRDLVALQLHRLPNIKALFLQANEISVVEGLDTLHDLRELVLDRNKIKNLSETSFANNWNLHELHLEENRLFDLDHLHSLAPSLQRLFLGGNRIQDLQEIEKLSSLLALHEISMVNNSVTRRLLHRPLLVYRLPLLRMLDGLEVTEEERYKANAYFTEQAAYLTATSASASSTQSNALSNVSQNMLQGQTTLPGIGTYKTSVPLRNMHLVGSHSNQSGLDGHWTASTSMVTTNVVPRGRFPTSLANTMKQFQQPQTQSSYYNDPSGRLDAVTRHAAPGLNKQNRK